MRLLLILLFTLVMENTSAQNLSSQQWENRILLIYTQDPALDHFLKQVADISQNYKDLKERKLIVYQITPSSYIKGIEPVAKWQSHQGEFSKYITPGTNFEVVLIGLDGIVKLRKSTSIDTAELFTKIDAMPIRRAEIRKTGNKPSL